jgi:Terminase DNA packaging enzyme
MSTKFEEKMSNFFEVEPIESEKNLSEKVSEPIPHETLDIDLKKDYEVARENFHELIDKGKEALEDILSIARDSEKGRDFEVAATLLKNVVEANERMIALHKQVRDIANYKQGKEDKTTIKNALFVGSTTELSKLVKELNTKDITPD